MKKFLVIGNPIDHSLSPKIHNFWIKENNLDAIYEKKKINENNIEEIITDIKEEKLVDYWRQKIPDILVAPFNKNVWSLI